MQPSGQELSILPRLVLNLVIFLLQPGIRSFRNGVLVILILTRCCDRHALSLPCWLDLAQPWGQACSRSYTIVSNEPSMPQWPAEPGGNFLIVTGWMDEWTDRQMDGVTGRAGHASFPSFWMPLASSQEAVGSPQGRCMGGSACPSVGGRLSHCTVVFRERLSSLAHSLKLRGLRGLQATPHLHS